MGCSSGEKPSLEVQHTLVDYSLQRRVSGLEEEGHRAALEELQP